MAHVSVTRLRLRSVRFLPGFALHALRATRQCRRAPGFLDGAVLPDRARTFWTLTLWRDRDAMRAYMAGGAHRAAMPRLLAWCDEASVVHWTPNEAVLPGWAEAERAMRDGGRPSAVRHPSPAHAGMGFAAARTGAATRIGPA